MCENNMTEEQSSAEVAELPTVPSQAEIYDSLRRIGELEDQRQSIQEEIDNRTKEIREAVKHVDRDSLLYKILTSALSEPNTPVKPRIPKAIRGTAKKSTRKRGRKR